MGKSIVFAGLVREKKLHNAAARHATGSWLDKARHRPNPLWGTQGAIESALDDLQHRLKKSSNIDFAYFGDFWPI